MYNEIMIGIDIVRIERVSLEKAFLEKVLTEKERELLERYKNEQRKKEIVAGRFAVKEAYFKATKDKDYLKISVLKKEDGSPYIEDHEDLDVSISHDAGIAIAIVSSRQS